MGNNNHISIHTGNEIDVAVDKINKIRYNSNEINRAIDKINSIGTQNVSRETFAKPKQIIKDEFVNISYKDGVAYIGLNKDKLREEIIKLIKINKKDILFGTSYNEFITEDDLKEFDSKCYNFEKKIEFYFKNETEDLLYFYIVLPNTFEYINKIIINNNEYEVNKQSIKYNTDEYIALRLKDKSKFKDIYVEVDTNGVQM